MSATFVFICSSIVSAVDLTVANSGFEDVTGQSVFNEFTFGTPIGWTIYDPNNITPDGGVYTGTLTPNGTDFFTGTAPEGTRVAILFNSTQRGAGAYGYEQTLTDTLQANTRYILSVEVGDIDSGIASNTVFFNLEGFPEYRLELLAGDEVVAGDGSNLIAQDDNTQVDLIVEGEFVRLRLIVTIGETHPRLGQALGIRLVSSNVVPPDDVALGFPDLEVDFDDVRLSTIDVPEPSINDVLFGSFTQTTISDDAPEFPTVETVHFNYDTVTGSGSLYGITDVFYENRIDFVVRQDGQLVVPQTFLDLTDFDAVEWRVNEDALDIQGTYGSSGFSAVVPLCGGCSGWSGVLADVTSLSQRTDLGINLVPASFSQSGDEARITLSIEDMEIGAAYAIDWTSDLSTEWVEIDEVIGTTYQQDWSSFQFSGQSSGNAAYFDIVDYPAAFLRLRAKTE